MGRGEKQTELRMAAKLTKQLSRISEISASDHEGLIETHQLDSLEVIDDLALDTSSDSNLLCTSNAVLAACVEVEGNV